MNVERLRAVQAEERESDSLRPLPDAFYAEVAEYLEGLREDRARAAEAAEDPFGDGEVRRLTDEIETAEEVAEAIYERRVGKLVKRASLAAAGMPVDEGGLTTEEAELFADLVAQIEAHRADVLAAFAPDGEQRGVGPSAVAEEAGRVDATETDAEREDAASPAADAGTDDAPREEAGPPESTSTPGGNEPPPGDGPGDEGDAADADESAAGSEGRTAPDDGQESTNGGEPDGQPERVTLRITRDVGEVFGVDERVYDLATEDVVTLPAANAKPLLERDAAEKVD